MSERDISPGYGALATALAALLVYAGALLNGFAFDDVVLIPGDPRVVNGDILALITRSYWNDAALALYRPLTSLTFALDWFVSNGSAAWFHFSNLLWHAAASILTYLLLLRFFPVPGALFGSLVFAAHPVHVEAIANVVGRAEPIAATFFLAACLVWISERLSRLTRALLVSLFYACAVLAKESAIVLPAVLVLLDFAQAQWQARARELRAYVRARTPELLAVALTAAVYLIIRWQVVAGLMPQRLDPSLEVLRGWQERLLTAFQAWPIMARLLVFPRTLLADYGPRELLPIAEWNSLAVLGATTVIVLVLGGLLAITTGRRLAALGLLWFPITILPVSNFILPIGVLLAERTLYLPSIALVFGLAALYTHARGRARRMTWALAALTVVVFSWRSMARVPEWRSTDSIMMALVRDQPESFRGQWHMARMARTRGDNVSALRRYARALDLWPRRQGLVEEAALYASAQGRSAWARDLATYGVRHWPNNVQFHRVVSASVLDMRDSTRALQFIRRGLQYHPQDRVLNDMWRAVASAKARQ